MANDAGILRLDSVEIQRVVRFLREVHQFGSTRLHSKCHLVGVDSRRDFRIADPGELLLVQRANQVERFALGAIVVACRIGNMQDRIPLAAKPHALVNRRQETGTPHRRPAAEIPSALQDHERRQVVSFAAQPVAEPRSHAGTTRDAAAGVDEQLGRRVIEQVGVDRFDDRDLIDDACQMRHDFGKLRPALAMTGKLEPWPEHRRIGLNERVTLAFDDRRWNRFAFQLRKLRFVIEHFQLARCAGHEQIDHPLCLGRKMRRLRCERTARSGWQEMTLARSRFRQAVKPAQSCPLRFRNRERSDVGFVVEVVRSWFRDRFVQVH